MPGDSMAPDMAAVEALTALGLTEYEARCFVAITQLSQGTAKEISRVADVPQSRVYDVTDHLHERGLIDVEESDPRRYQAAPVDLAIDRLEGEYSDHLTVASDALHGLDSRERDDDGAWAIASREDVLLRLERHLANASEEIYLFVADEALLDDELFDALAAAHDPSIATYVEVPSDALRTAIHDRLPAANVAVSDPLGSVEADGRGPGRLLMVDRETILMSARTEGLAPGECEETGLWGSEVGHGLVVWMRSLLSDRIDRLEFTTADS